MANIKDSGTGLFLELEIAEGPSITQVLFVTYKRLGTGCPNGCVSSPARPAALIVPQEEGARLVTRVNTWTGEVRSNQSIVTEPLADLPLELDSMVVSPDGITYEIKMASLAVEISWDKASDLVTIEAGLAFTVTLEGFLYYVETLKELIKAIELAKAA